MLNTILWLPKQLILSHYDVIANLAYLRCDQAQIDRKIEAMRRRLFGRD